MKQKLLLILLSVLLIAIIASCKSKHPEDFLLITKIGMSKARLTTLLGMNRLSGTEADMDEYGTKMQVLFREGMFYTEEVNYYYYFIKNKLYKVKITAENSDGQRCTKLAQILDSKFRFVGSGGSWKRWALMDMPIDMDCTDDDNQIEIVFFDASKK